MKKLIALLLAAVMLLAMVACGNEPADPTDNDISGGGNKPEQTKPEDGTKPNQDEETKPFDPENWGSEDHYTAKNENGLQLFYINFPHYGGTNDGCGKVANQQDGTAVVLSGQNNIAPTIGGLSELFPAYFDHLQYTLEAYYGILSDNYAFSLKDNEALTVNDYQMHKFSGEFSFDDDGEHREYQFVAYATTLKSNGAYAYWVVYDNSADQSNGDLIAQHALNMAKTFREEQ